MSVWEFHAAVEGWLAAHAPEQGLSASEEDELWAAVQARMGRVN